MVWNPVSENGSIAALQQDAILLHIWETASPSSCPVWRASAAPSFFTCLPASGCHPFLLCSSSPPKNNFLLQRFPPFSSHHQKDIFLLAIFSSFSFTVLFFFAKFPNCPTTSLLLRITFCKLSFQTTCLHIVVSDNLLFWPNFRNLPLWIVFSSSNVANCCSGYEFVNIANCCSGKFFSCRFLQHFANFCFKQHFTLKRSCMTLSRFC